MRQGVNNNKAVFLDRDGVINYPVLNLNTNEYEAPQSEEDLKLFPDTLEALNELNKMNFMLFLVSNQPDFAKGKTSLENLLSVHKKLHKILTDNNIHFKEYYYCYHHPKGKITEYTTICECRKPGDLFLRQASLKYSLDPGVSWMIGDRDVDIFCGQKTGTRTILIKQNFSNDRAKESKPDYVAKDLSEAINIIKTQKDKTCHN